MAPLRPFQTLFEVFLATVLVVVWLQIEVQVDCVYGNAHKKVPLRYYYAQRYLYIIQDKRMA